jgi:AAA domain
MADHFVQVDRLAALRESAEQPARLDLAKLLRIADEDELGLRLLRLDRAEHEGGEGLPRESVLLIDEAGMVDSATLARLVSHAERRLATVVAGTPSDCITFAARQVGAAACRSIPACVQPSAAAAMAKVLPLPASPITTATPSGLVKRRRIISRWSSFKVGRA